MMTTLTAGISPMRIIRLLLKFFACAAPLLKVWRPYSAALIAWTTPPMIWASTALGLTVR